MLGVSSNVSGGPMRFLMKISLPVETANKAIQSDGLAVIPKILNQVKPEAAYFGTDKGQRTAFLVVNMDKGSELPALAEPWFLALNALIELTPVMVAEDLASAAPSIEQAVKDFSCTTA